MLTINTIYFICLQLNCPFFMQHKKDVDLYDGNVAYVICKSKRRSGSESGSSSREHLLDKIIESL